MSESGYSSDESFSERDFYLAELNQFRKKYEIKYKLMTSANGDIFTGCSIQDQRTVIVKKIAKKCGINRQSGIPPEIYFHQEASKLSDQVVELIEYFELKKSFVIILEKPENSIDLFEFVTRYGPMNELMAVTVIKKIAHVCVQLFNGGICHRDVKTENILFNPLTFDIKLIDFGSATRIEPFYSKSAGTQDYLPPEVMPTPDKLTSWSLGCVLYILLTAKSPFGNGDFIFNFCKINCSFKTKLLISNLLNTDSNQRMSIFQF